MELHLNDQQAKELHSLLTQALGDLSAEIADTDNPTFQRGLRERRLQLQIIEEQLNEASVA
jgi:hypothetical protein